MIQTVTVFSNTDTQDVISGMLEKNGVPLRYRCRTGAEAIRAVKKMGGGVVVCAYKMADMTADELAEALHDEAMLLVVAKPVQLDMCEADGIFKIAVPVRAGELVGSVNMLTQLSDRKNKARIPQRNDEERELLQRAKELLMSRRSMTESEAHRLIQRRSMASSAKMVDTARQILASAE